MSLDIVWGGKAAPLVNLIIGDFVAQRVWGDERGFEDFTSMGVVDDEKLIAGVVFHNYSPHARTIEISGASDSRKWLQRPVLHAMYAYPFEQLSCQMVVQRNSEHNEHLNRILRRFGFDEYRIERLRGPDEAELIFTLTKEQWLNNGYYKGKIYGQTQSSRAA